MGHVHWLLMTPLLLAGGRPLTSDSLLSSVAENYGVANLRPKIGYATNRLEIRRENCHRIGNTKQIRNHEYKTESKGKCSSRLVEVSLTARHPGFPSPSITFPLPEGGSRSAVIGWLSSVRGSSHASGQRVHLFCIVFGVVLAQAADKPRFRTCLTHRFTQLHQ